MSAARGVAVTSVEASIHPSLLKRKIIHFDMDAFYASVEIRDRPDLADKAVVIGGSPNSRGVVCTANYIARKFGIHSAMPCSQAYRLCPQAVFIRPDFTKYKEVSHAIREIFGRYTALIEPLSLDEAYLDVTNNSAGLYATQVAIRIQKAIFAELALTGSAGVAPNKLVAKIATEFHKPNGLTIVMPEQVLKFMAQLPLRKINGIGPASDQKLEKHGLRVCGDVWTWPLEKLEATFGNTGEWLYRRSRGIDEREVESERERKSLGKEDTFASDILDIAHLKIELKTICEDVVQALEKRQLRGRTITLKVKYADFTRITRSFSLDHGTRDFTEIFATVENLLLLTEAGRQKIRLLGVILSNFDGAASQKKTNAGTLLLEM